jgi:hypothetical protein
MNGGMQTLDGITPNKRLSGGSSPTSPIDIAGLLFWYKTPISGASNGVAIAAWPDSSSAARDATPNGAGLIYRTAVINSLATVECSGDYATFSAASLGTAHTTFIVIRPKAGFADGVVIGGDALGKYTPYTDTTDIYYRAVGSEAFVTVANGGISADTPYLFEIVRSGVNVDFYKNGVQLSTTQTLAANTALTVSQLFAVNGQVIASQLQIAEVFVYDSALSTSDREAMESYISDRFAFF